MSRPARPSRGGALPAALVVVAIAGAVSAAVATLARTEVILSRNREAAARALAAADGCLAAVVAELPAGWEFDAAIAGADGSAGTADDGVRPAPAGCAARVRPAPGPAEPPRAVLEVEAVAGGGRRSVEAVVGRVATPGVPALIWLAEAASLGELHGLLTLAGADAAHPAAPALAPLAAPLDPAALDAWLAAQAGHVVVSPAGAPPIGVPAPPLAELATRLRAAGAAPGGTLVPAGDPPLALTLLAGDLVVSATARGQGVLFVDGLLDIGGVFEFSGVVVASGGIRVASGARLDVTGAVWLGSGATLVVDGEARVAAHADALAAADGLLRLPRRTRVTGQRDPP